MMMMLPIDAEILFQMMEYSSSEFNIFYDNI